MKQTAGPLNAAPPGAPKPLAPPAVVEEEEEELDEDGNPKPKKLPPGYVETDLSKLKCWGKIQNQQIPHILITPTFRCAILCYTVLAAVLFGFGALCYTSAAANHDFLMRYDDKCNGKAICSVQFTLDETLKSPKIYYQLENFYANHRNFVKSRNYKQLRGNVLGSGDLGSTCDPVKYMKDLGDNIPKVALDKTVLRTDDIAYPCGLIAKYFFNDTYSLADEAGARIAIDETNIA
jgi:hypothetical protein